MTAVRVTSPGVGGASAPSPGLGAQVSTPAVGGRSTPPGSFVVVPGGRPGPPGMSAYEVAVTNGFTGTEAEWLAEIEGPEGPQGLPGSPGLEPDMPSLSLILENGLV